MTIFYITGYPDPDPVIYHHNHMRQTQTVITVSLSYQPPVEERQRRMAISRRLKTVIIIVETFTIIGVAVASIMMRQFLTPFKRGYFKDDESLMYPFKSSSVTNIWLYAVGFVGVSLMMIFGEFVTVKAEKELKGKFSWRRWGKNCYRLISVFALGAAMTHLLTNLQKYAVGRLRPHFFSVCQPDWSRLNSTQGYITEDLCTGTDTDLIQEARLAFPSGHASISMYCAIFLMLYLYKRYTYQGFVPIRPLLQLTAFCLALYTGLSRISDYKHHGLDVFAGALLGTVLAFLSIFKIIDFFKAEAQRASAMYSIGAATPTEYPAEQINGQSPHLMATWVG